ncbi:MAG: leucine-rich repeat protein, partial [Cyanobacteria bacterium MAG CAR1_bin_15]|nr:leucine-rich repeat protein [Cyanobacteria bacterium MAG CAR1_bin_15]
MGNRYSYGHQRYQEPPRYSGQVCNLRNKGITSLKSGDFDDLPNLVSLFLDKNALTSLPEDIFDGLSSLKELRIGGYEHINTPSPPENPLTTLPEDIFDGLSELRLVDLTLPKLTTLPENIFDGLSKLRIISMHGTRLTTLPEDLFDGLSELREIYLGYYGSLTTLPEDLFDGLSELREIRLWGNRLTSLPAGLFDGLSKLTEIRLSENKLTTLPSGLFDGLSNISIIDLSRNFKLDTLPWDIFDGLSNLQVMMYGNALTCWPKIPPGVEVSLHFGSKPLPLCPVAVSITGGSSVTEGGDVVFTLTADPAPTSDLQTYVKVTETGSFGLYPPIIASYWRGGFPVTIGTSGTVDFTVRTDDDDVDEADGVIHAYVNDGTGYYSARSIRSATVAVADNDATSVTLAGAVNNLTPERYLVEGTNTSFTVTLGRELVGGESLAVPLIFGGAATHGADYTITGTAAKGVSYQNLNSAGATVTFTGPESGRTAKVATLTLTATPDIGVDKLLVSIGLGPLDARLSGGATGTDNLADFNIVDLNFAMTPVVTVTPNVSTVTEGPTATAGFTVSASPPPDSPLTVNLTVADGSASDFVASGSEGSQTVTIPAGAASAVYTVGITDDQRDEPRDMIRVTATDGTGYLLATSPTATVTVIDDDATTVVLTIPDTAATKGLAGSTANMVLKLNRGLGSGEALSIPLAFAGGTVGTDFTLSLMGAPRGISLSGSTITFTGPASGWSAARATVLLTASANNNPTNTTVTVSIPSSSTGAAPILSATGLAGGATGGRTGDGRITLVDLSDQSKNICERYEALGYETFGWNSHLSWGRQRGQWSAQYRGQVCNLRNKGITSLKPGDFDGLPNLVSLFLDRNALTSLPLGVFDELSSLKDIRIGGYTNLTGPRPPENPLTSLPEDIFDGLSELREVDLSLPKLTTLPEDIFDGLSKLRYVRMYNTRLTTLPENLFDGLSELRQIGLGSGSLTTLPENLFDGLSELRYIYLWSNPLISLPAGLLDGLSSLHSISLSETKLTTLPSGLFDGLSSLKYIYLGNIHSYPNGKLDTLPWDIFEGLSNLQVMIYDTDLTCLPKIPPGSEVWGSRKSKALPLCRPVAVSIAGGSAVIEGGDVTFTLTADPAPAADIQVTVSVSESGDVAASGETGARTVTIGTGGTVDFTVSTEDDDVDETDGTIAATVTAGTGYTVGSAATASVVVRDDDDTNPYAALIARVRGYVAETANGEEHVNRWQRVLKALGEDDAAFAGLTPMTASEAQTYADRGWSRWEPVATALTALEAAAQPPVQPTITIAGGSAVTEGGDVTFTLTANPAPAANLVVTVSVSESGNVASSGATGTRTVTIDTSGTVDFTVATEDDAIDEADGSIAATVTAGTGYTVGSVATASVAVADNDVPPEVNITSAAGGSEGDDVTFVITATPAPTAALPVSVTVTAAGDYGISTGVRTVSIPTGGSFTLTLSTTDDTVDEEDGSVTLTLGTGAGYTVGSLSSQTASITDDDVATEQQVDEDNGEDDNPYAAYADLIADVRAYVAETANGEEHVKRWQRVLKALGEDDAAFAGLTPMTASEAQTYADRGWSRWEPVATALTALEAAAQPPVQPTITIAGGSAVTEGGDVVFTLTANPAPAANLAVTVSVTENGNVATSGETGARTVTIGTGGTVDFTVSTENDDVDEADGSIAATVTAGTGYTVGSVATASVVVRDDEVPTVSIAGGSAVTEGGEVVFTLTANPVPAANLAVTVSVSETGNVASSGATGTRTVTIGTGGTVDFTVATEDDATDEADGSIAATVTTGTGYTVGSTATASVVVRDDEVPTISITGGSAVTEGGDVTFTLTATPPPAANLPVTVSVSESGNVASGGATGTRTVTIGTGGTVAFTVATEDDAIDEADGSIAATVTAGTGYTVGSVATASVVVRDDEVPTVSI